MEKEEFSSAISTLHNLGYLLHYSSPHLTEYVILDPQWMSDSLRKVVTVNPQSIGYVKEGWFYHNQCEKIWPGYSPSVHKFLLELLYYFGIAIPTKGGKSLIPCRLPSAPLDILTHKLFNGHIRRKVEFEDFIPSGISSLIVSSEDLYPYLNLQQCWSNGAVFEDIAKQQQLLLLAEEKSIQLIGDGIHIIQLITTVIQRELQRNWSGIALKDKTIRTLGVKYLVQLMCLQCGKLLWSLEKAEKRKHEMFPCQHCDHDNKLAELIGTTKHRKRNDLSLRFPFRRIFSQCMYFIGFFYINCTGKGKSRRVQTIDIGREIQHGEGRVHSGVNICIPSNNWLYRVKYWEEEHLQKYLPVHSNELLENMLQRDSMFPTTMPWNRSLRLSTSAQKEVFNLFRSWN